MSLVYCLDTIVNQVLTSSARSMLIIALNAVVFLNVYTYNIYVQCFVVMLWPRFLLPVIFQLEKRFMNLLTTFQCLAEIPVA